MDKNEVRQLIKAYRQKLTDEDVKIQSRLIIDRLKKSDIYKTSENVFLYMSYNREVDTYMLLSQCLTDNKKLYAPKVLSKTDMEFYCIQDEHDLVSGYMGIMEPSDAVSYTHLTLPTKRIEEMDFLLCLGLRLTMIFTELAMVVGFMTDIYR